MVLTTQQRNSKAEDIVNAMRQHYEDEGEEGDFDDALRYYKHDASEAELQADYDKWVKNGTRN